MLLFLNAQEGSPRAENDALEALLSGVAAGQREAFCALYEQTRGRIYAYALSILRQTQDAEDAMQDTFLKIRSAAHLYEPRGKPLAWMLTVCKNVCLMELRRKQHTAALTPEAEAVLAAPDTLTDAEDRAVLEAAFRSLDPVSLRVILLHAAVGLRHREIAKTLELPLSTVLSKYNRGIKRLQLQLEDVIE